jgi:hypothetical protein
MPGSPDLAGCLVAEMKIAGYLLDREHAKGRSKAAFFEARGFVRSDWRKLADALRRHASENAVVAQPASPHGVKWVFDCRLHTPDGTDPCIRSIWMQRPGDTAPSLVSAYPHR